MGGPDYVDGGLLQIMGVVSNIKVSLKVSISSCQGAEPNVGPDTPLHSFMSSSGLDGHFSRQLRSGDRLGVDPNSGSQILFSKA